jgi:hypothetical protein
MDDRWLFAMVGAAVGWFITHSLAMKRDRINARRTAAANFRSSVLTALNGLYPVLFGWPKDPTEILRRVAPALQSKVEQFRPFVSDFKQKDFDRAWFRYRSGTGRVVDVQIYHHYVSFESSPDPKGTFRKNVEALLSFATDEP